MTPTQKAELAGRYGFTVIPKRDSDEYQLVNNGHRFLVWYTSYSRGTKPWAVARITKVPEGERGAGQDQYNDHQYFTELEDAFVYASGETLDVMEVDGVQVDVPPIN